MYFYFIIILFYYINLISHYFPPFCFILFIFYFIYLFIYLFIFIFILFYFILFIFFFTCSIFLGFLGGGFFSLRVQFFLVFCSLFYVFNFFLGDASMLFLLLFCSCFLFGKFN